MVEEKVVAKFGASVAEKNPVDRKAYSRDIDSLEASFGHVELGIQMAMSSRQFKKTLIFTILI